MVFSGNFIIQAAEWQQESSSGPPARCLCVVAKVVVLVSFFFFFFAPYLLLRHLKVTANACVLLYARGVAVMTQVRPQASLVRVKTAVHWLGGKVGTQTSLFSFPCFYFPAPIFR